MTGKGSFKELAISQENCNLIPRMNDGEVAIFVPGKYSIYSGFVGRRNVIQGFAGLNLVDDAFPGYRGGGGLPWRSGFGSGNEESFTYGHATGRHVVPVLKLLGADMKSACDPA